MRFMMLMIPKGYERAEPGVMPDVEMVEAMTKYNEELKRAGALISLDALHPPSAGARVSFAQKKPRVAHGPFSDTRETLGGFWMIQVNSLEDAIEWAKRCPAADGDTIEIRQVQEMSDFPENIRMAASGARAENR